ncbi:unnamed protein product [Darwinula stevensoni]|uniref:Secreted protein n=1 Tax=Darwinula stevensoni TaxID=69355 RepID=A0A7R8WZT5_9CRUS|nr:unnamed protein product [Darwinula stevensoni]CAG0880490.1 unnamed protein product [Darwinula stevensoni]
MSRAVNCMMHVASLATLLCYHGGIPLVQANQGNGNPSDDASGWPTSPTAIVADRLAAVTALASSPFRWIGSVSRRRRTSRMASLEVCLLFTRAFRVDRIFIDPKAEIKFCEKNRSRNEVKANGRIHPKSQFYNYHRV